MILPLRLPLAQNSVHTTEARLRVTRSEPPERHKGDADREGREHLLGPRSENLFQQRTFVDLTALLQEDGRWCCGFN